MSYVIIYAALLSQNNTKVVGNSSYIGNENSRKGTKWF